MRVFNTDKATYILVTSENVKSGGERFDSFAAAAGAASAMPNITRFINVTFESPNGDSALSGSLYCYDRVTNERRVCNQYLVNEVTKRSGL